MADQRPEQNDLSNLAAKGSGNLLVEFWDFMRHRKKWWLTPIVLTLLLLGVLVMLGSTAAAPFIYTLF